jgi:hypothetical protein
LVGAIEAPLSHLICDHLAADWRPGQTREPRIGVEHRKMNWVMRKRRGDCRSSRAELRTDRAKLKLESERLKQPGMKMPK